MNSCFRKYCLKYIIRNALLIFGICGFLSLLLLVVGCIYNNLSKNLALVIFPISVGLVIFLTSNLFMINFYNIVHEQEQKYGIPFNDKNAKKLCALIYLTDDWLIDSGTKAILRKNIQNINFRLEHSNRGGSAIKVRIKTEDSSYYINVFDKNDVQRLQLWYTYSNDKPYKF